MTLPTKQNAVSEAMNPPRPFRRRNIAHGFTQSLVLKEQCNTEFRSDLGILILALAGYDTWVPEELALLTTSNNVIVGVIVLAT